MTYDTKGQIVVCSKSEFNSYFLVRGNDMNYEGGANRWRPLSKDNDKDKDK